MTSEALPLFELGKLASAMDDVGVSAIVAHSRRNFFYLSGFTSLDYSIEAEAANYVIVPRDPGHPAIVTIPASEALSLQDEPIWVPRKIICGNFYIKDLPPGVESRAPDTWDGLVLGLREAGLDSGRVGFELEQLSVASHQRLRDALPKLELVDVSPVLRRLRMTKTSEEIRRVRVACAATEDAIDSAIARVRPGATEREIACLISEGMISRGVDVLYAQVSTGAAAGLGGPSDRVVRSGDVVRTDVAGVYKGYHSDLGRGFAIDRATPVQRGYYRVAYEALQGGIAAVRIGAPVDVVFPAAMSAWARAGHPEVKRHHVGHGIGLQAHESPMVRPGSTQIIEAGMVLAIEVPCYVYNVGGFAPEDNLVVGVTGLEVLTQAPSEMPIV